MPGYKVAFCSDSKNFLGKRLTRTISIYTIAVTDLIISRISLNLIQNLQSPKSQMNFLVTLDVFLHRPRIGLNASLFVQNYLKY